MRFRREVYDGIELILLKYVLDLGSIRDVTAHESVPRVGGDFFEVAKIAGVREKVVIDDFNVLAGSKHKSHKARTNEPGAASDQNLHYCLLKMAAELLIAS